MTNMNFIFSPDAVNSNIPIQNAGDIRLTIDYVYLSTDGGKTHPFTNPSTGSFGFEFFISPGCEYDFCADVKNISSLPTGAFYVRFMVLQSEISRILTLKKMTA